MNQLLIRSPLTDVSGYGAFSRNIALALYRSGLVPGIMRMTSQLMSSYLPNSPAESWELEEMLKQKINNYDESVVLNICPAVTFNHCYGFDLGYTMTEVDKLSDEWIECCNKMDLVLVPGPWNEEVHKENGVKNVMGFAPALDTETYQPQSEDKYGIHEELNRFPFNFVTTAHVMKTKHDRKGTKKLIRCFAREFSKDKDVGLILKCAILNHFIMDRIGFIRHVQDILIEEGHPEVINQITFIHRNQTSGEMATMYSFPNVRCFVAPTCLHPEADIIIRNGIKSIKDVNVGEFVLTGTGKYEIVERVIKNEYNGDLLKIKADGLPTISITPEHMVYRIKKPRAEYYFKQMKKTRKATILLENADTLSVGDYLLYPIPETSEERKIINTEKYWSKRFRWGLRKTQVDLSREIILDYEFGLICGFYLSEGCLTKDGISFSFHTKESYYYNPLIESIKNKFGARMRMYHMARNRTAIFICSLQMRRMFFDLFGSNSHSKHLPDWILDSPKDFRRGLIEGIWRGDGCLYYVQGKYTLWEIQTVSKQLMYGLFNLLIAEGFRPTLSNMIERFVKYKDIIRKSHTLRFWKLKIQGKQDFGAFIGEKDIYKSRKTAGRTWSDGKYVYYPISKIEKEHYDGAVYNLTVNNEHNFVSNFLVKNCGEGFGMNMLEAASCGLPIMTTEYSEHINYIPKQSLIPIKHDLIDVQEEFWHNNSKTVYPKGSRWVMANDEDVMNQMRTFYEENKTKPKEHIKADFSELSYSSFAKRFITLIDGLEIKKKQFVVPEKVQLATGSDPQDGYYCTNIDTINTCQIDLLMDARQIVFPANSIKKYLVIHLFEHLFDCDIASILMSIHKTLIPGGEVEVHIPDIYWAIGEIIKMRGLDREERYNRIKTVVLGTHEFHKNIITPERLEMFLRISGFEKIERFDVVDKYDFIAKEDYDSNVRVSLKMRAFKPLLET